MRAVFEIRWADLAGVDLGSPPDRTVYLAPVVPGLVSATALAVLVTALGAHDALFGAIVALVC
jgi:hypothetical protein